MAYGYGRVAAATFVGFTIGLVVALEQWLGNGVRVVGLVSLSVGLFTMFTRKMPIIGVPGGLLTGFGLGVDTASTFTSPPFSNP
jgi:hypothetical protein